MRGWWRWRRPQPTPHPENVRIVLPSQGRVIPVECVYDGIDDDGYHAWRAVFPVDVGTDIRGMSIACDVLPARTSIRVDLFGRR